MGRWEEIMGFDQETFAERQAEALQARMDAFAADYAAPLPAGDAGLVEAWRRYAEIDRRFDEEGLGDSFEGLDLDVSQSIIDDTIVPLQDELREFIKATEPRTIAGALVTLRLVHEYENLDEDPATVAALAVIERAAVQAGILDIPARETDRAA
jgi:hypothetical protein